MRQTRARSGLTLATQPLRLFCATALLVLVALALHANPAREPKRLVNGRTADITPLIKWWTNHSGTRPLTAWVHVRGPIVGTNAGCWVVAAHVERAHRDETSSDDSGKVLLKNPPLQERAEFEQLSAQLKSLEQSRGQVHAQEEQAKSQADALHKQETANRRLGYRSRALAAENRQAKQTENEAKAELKPLDQQIQNLKKKLAIYPTTDHYEVDCFALALALDQNHGGLYLYDHGVVIGR
jgi:hypothetical protein